MDKRENAYYPNRDENDFIVWKSALQVIKLAVLERFSSESTTTHPSHGLNMHPWTPSIP